MEDRATSKDAYPIKRLMLVNLIYELTGLFSFCNNLILVYYLMQNVPSQRPETHPTALGIKLLQL
jgi:hypothetical protein